MDKQFQVVVGLYLGLKVGDEAEVGNCIWFMA